MFKAGTEPFLGSNQPQKTPANDNTKGMESSPHQTGENHQNLQITCNELTDDPYGIFEPDVQQINFEGTFVY